jgi:hypothetical protein
MTKLAHTAAMAATAAAGGSRRREPQWMTLTRQRKIFRPAARELA